jgi:diaminohydroxyphosphoribosylaminopyrimidine deaminase / 5-amino-6-(5-phosphoribosylamino)uracil reductase
LDFLNLAIEEARRATGCVAPNPLVGAVIERDGVVLSAGYHARAGDLHAETAALAGAGDVRGATMYVTLEPCRHHGKQPPCVAAIVGSGIARVVVGALDPNPLMSGRGVDELRAAGIAVEVRNDPGAERLIEDFRVWIRGVRPYVALKMAASVDGYIASAGGVRQQLTGEPWGAFVRDLRTSCDAVMVGAGTIRVDDPLLTVRPPHQRSRPYVRVVVCETDGVPRQSRVFEPVDGYAKTVVVAPAGVRARFDELAGTADLLFAGDERTTQLDLTQAMRALYDHNIYSVLCEGGPTLAGRLIGAGLVDRFYWGIAPLFLHGGAAVPVLAGVDLATPGAKVRLDRAEQVGEDVMISGTFDV